MANSAPSPTKAHQSARSALRVVDDVLGYMKDTQGKPAKKERALFASAIVFTYGIWENYVELLAIELAQKVSEKIPPERVPEGIRRLLEKGSAWELAVSPGWRRLWVQRVKLQAIGDDVEKYGLNTAKAGQVRSLLQLAGVQDAFAGLDVSMVPAHLSGTIKEVCDALNDLVELRGQIVHTGRVPDSLRKNHVREWRQFVESIVAKLDSNCRKECDQLLT